MKLDSGLEGNVDKQLIIRTTLYPVLSRALALVESAGLGSVEERADGSGVVVSIEDLAVSDLDLISNVTIAAWEFCASPARRRGAARTRLESRDFLGDLFRHLLQLDRIGSLDLVLDLAVAEDQKTRGLADSVRLGQLAIFIKVDLDK